MTWSESYINIPFSFKGVDYLFDVDLILNGTCYKDIVIDTYNITNIRTSSGTCSEFDFHDPDLEDALYSVLYSLDLGSSLYDYYPECYTP